MSKFLDALSAELNCEIRIAKNDRQPDTDVWTVKVGKPYINSWGEKRAQFHEAGEVYKDTFLTPGKFRIFAERGDETQTWDNKDDAIEYIVRNFVEYAKRNSYYGF